MKVLYSEDEQTFTNTNDQSFSPTNSFIPEQVRPRKGQANRNKSGGEDEFRPNPDQLHEIYNSNIDPIHSTHREGMCPDSRSAEWYNQGEIQNLNKGGIPRDPEHNNNWESKPCSKHQSATRFEFYSEPQGTEGWERSSDPQNVKVSGHDSEH